MHIRRRVNLEPTSQADSICFENTVDSVFRENAFAG